MVNDLQISLFIIFVSHTGGVWWRLGRHEFHYGKYGKKWFFVETCNGHHEVHKVNILAIFCYRTKSIKLPNISYILLLVKQKHYNLFQHR